MTLNYISDILIPIPAVLMIILNSNGNGAEWNRYGDRFKAIKGGNGLKLCGVE